MVANVEWILRTTKYVVVLLLLALQNVLLMRTIKSVQYEHISLQ